MIIWFLIVDEWLHAAPLFRDLRELALRGNDVACMFPIAKHWSKIDSGNVKLEVIPLIRPMRVFSLLWFCAKAGRLLVRRYRDVDAVILSVDVLPFLLPLLLSMRSSKTKIAIRELGPSVEVRSTHSYHLLFLERVSLLLSRLADSVFTVSPMRAGELGKLYHIQTPKLHVWPSSVDTAIFNPAGRGLARAHLREALGVQDKRVLIYHGVLSEERGLYELIKATGLVHASAVVIPSLWPENAPLVALEAFSVGTPVVGANRGGLPEIIAKLSPELIFSWEREGDLKRAIQHATHQNLLLKENALEVHRQVFSPAGYMASYLKLISERNDLGRQST